MSNTRLSTALILASLALAAPAFAQSDVASAPAQTIALGTALAPALAAPVALKSAPASPAANSSSASLMAAQPRGVALSRQRAVVDSMTPPAPADNDRGNTALMLAGGAAMIVGAVVGDDAGTLIIVGGAIIGFYGLYRFLTN